ncbi:MAG: hypothetical protein ABIG43_06895 [Chloroflexota bacterium]
MEEQTVAMHQADKHESLDKHRRQSMWQILAPLLIFCVLVLAAAVIIAINAGQGSGDVSQWADTSFIIMILPAMLISLIPLVLLVGLICLTAQLLKKIPVYSFSTQQFFKRVTKFISIWADRSVKPIIVLQEILAGISNIGERLYRKSK